jgi:hypothetical protein
MAEAASHPEPDHYLARTLEWAARRRDLRQPTRDELQLLTEARAAGATFPAHLWEAYFSGASPRFPMQFEGTYVGLMSDYPDVVEACEAAAAERDAFLARVSPGGDLRPLVEAIEADRAIAPLARSSAAAAQRVLQGAL